VPHVHVHIIPRKKQDYAENDEIYNHLGAFPKIEDKDRVPRTVEDMEREAAWLENFFKS
jgi:bis(5'-adenosyl)-triphosphatase